MTSDTKSEKQRRPKLSVLSGNAGPGPQTIPGLPVGSAQALTNLEKFQEMIQDIVSFEIKASGKLTNSDSASNSAPINLTRARVAGLESIKLDTPSQVMRLINTDSNSPNNTEDSADRPKNLASVEAIQSQRSPKNGKKK